MVDWDQLPKDILHLIAKKLFMNEDYLGFKDYLAFGSCCKSWRYVVKEEALLPCPTRMFPLLMLPYNGAEKRYEALSRSDDKMYRLKLSNSPGLRFVGSSNGWLITVDIRPSICLRNVLTGKTIELPPVTTFPDVVCYEPSQVNMEYTSRCIITNIIDSMNQERFRDIYITKAVLSSDPIRDPKFVVMVLHDQLRQLAFCRNGDDKWTQIEQEWIFTQELRIKETFFDVIYYNKYFYGARIDGSVFRCEQLHSSSPQLIEVIPPVTHECLNHPYLVESSGGELLQVRRISNRVAVGFRVYRLELEQKTRTLLNTIGDAALFLGLNSTIGLSIHDFPGLQRNCIYFTKEITSHRGYDKEFGNDMGVFNLEDNSIRNLPCMNTIKDRGCIWPAPIWLNMADPSSSSRLS